MKSDNKINTHLFPLIKSMKPSEKRYFKVFAKKHVIRQSNNYVSLFNIIDGMQDYNEQEVRHLFKTETGSGNIAEAKYYLYRLVLKSLHSFHISSSADAKLKEQLHHVEVLYRKALYDQCLKLLAAAKAFAYRHEKHIYLMEILAWEIRIGTGEMKLPDNRLEEIFSEETNVINLYKNTALTRNLANKIIMNQGPARKSADLQAHKAVIKNPVFRSEKNALTYESRFFFYKAFSTYCLIKGDYLNSYKFDKKFVDLIESRPQHIAESPNDYTVGLHNLALKAIYLKKYNECLEQVKKLRELPAKYKLKSGHDYIKIFIRSNLAELNVYLDTGNYKKAVLLVPSIEQGLSAYDKQISDTHKLFLYYYTAYAYLLADDNRKAIQWLNKILNTTWNTAEIVPIYARILNLIAHFQLKNYDTLDYLVKSTYRFLYKSRHLYKSESIILSFIGKKLLRVTSDAELVMAFRELKEELTAISKDRFERRALEYFDFIYWLESKISNRPFAEVVKENTKTAG